MNMQNPEGLEGAMSLADAQRADRQLINETLDSLRKRLWELDAALRRDKAQPRVGKFFRFRNNIVPSESWWEYVAITGVTEDGMLRGVRFARSMEHPDPDLNFKMGSIYFEPSELEEIWRYEEIPRGVFEGHVSHFLLDQQEVIDRLLGKEKTS